jgi:hypothetical protein
VEGGGDGPQPKVGWDRQLEMADSGKVFSTQTTAAASPSRMRRLHALSQQLNTCIPIKIRLREMTTQSRKNNDIQPIRDQVLKRMLKMPPRPHVPKKRDTTAKGGNTRKKLGKGQISKIGG